MRKVPSYSTGGGIKGDPKKPVKSTIDRTKYKDILSKPISGEGTNVVGGSQDNFTPEVLKSMGYNYVSGTMRDKDIVYEKNGNYHIYNEQPNATQNKYGLINIGNPNTPITTTTAPTSTIIQNQPIQRPIDPNKKSLNFNDPGLIYDPNTGNYKNNVTGKFIEPIVQQYANGGKVKPLAKYYAQGGSIGYSEKIGQANALTQQQQQQTQQPASKNPWINANQAQALGGAAMVAGNQLYQPPTNYTNPDQQRQDQNINASVDATASSLTPWYGLAKGASNIGKSQLSTDKYGYTTQGAARTSEEWLTPFHEKAVSNFKNGDMAGGFRDITGTGTFLRGISKGLKQDEKTSGFWGKFNNATGITDENADRNANISAINEQDRIAKEEADKRRQALIQGGINQAITARDLGELNYQLDKDTVKAIKNDAALKTEQDKMNLFSSNYKSTGGIGNYFKNKFADGGVIKGAGTPKSDSISANIKPGSHIVPAENVGIAKIIKKEVLGKNPNKEAKLNQNNGTPVKISTEEFIFTPEEKSELEDAGIDLNELSPLAQSATAFKDGGPTPEKAKEILKDGTIYGKKITDRQRRFFGYIAGQGK